jgi:hypothetical protein
MSSSKKTTAKATKSPAPATKSAAAKASATKKTVRSVPVQTATPTPVAMLAPSPARPATPAVKVVAPKPIVTTVTARVDVGFGNTLFVRGEGAGLSWNKGLAMECIGPDLWQIVLEESARAYTFKFLLNDITWSTGPDYTAACGTSVTLSPRF